MTDFLYEKQGARLYPSSTIGLNKFHPQIYQNLLTFAFREFIFLVLK